MLHVSIHRADPADAPLLTEIAHAAKRHWGYPESWIAAWCDALTLAAGFVAEHAVFAAYEGEDPIAFYAVVGGAEIATLEHLWVRPDRMARGVGRRLLEHARTAAAASGARALRIDADPHAEGFYLRMGARRVGETPADVAGVRRLLPRLLLPLVQP